MSATTTLSFVAVGTLATEATTDQLAAHVREVAPFLVPGVLAWDEVRTERLANGRVRLFATLVAQTTPLVGDYEGQVPDGEFVAAYAQGAGATWLYAYDGPVFVAEIASVRAV